MVKYDLPPDLLYVPVKKRVRLGLGHKNIFTPSKRHMLYFLSQDKKFRQYFFKYLMLKELKPNHSNPVVALVTRKKLTQESQLDEDGEQFV